MAPDDTSAEPRFETNVTAELPKLRLSKPHPLIKRTMDLKTEKDAYGYVRQPVWPGVDVGVGKATKRIPFIVLDRLFKALEKADISVEVLQHHNYNDRNQEQGTFAVRGRDRTRIYISEVCEKVEHLPTAKELREKERFPRRSRIPKWDDVPTGKLMLEPGGVLDLSSEEALGLVIAKSVEEVVQRLDAEEAKRKSAEEAKHKEYLRQKAEQDEKARVESLHKSSDALHRYQQLMNYIEEVRCFGKVPEDQRREGQSLEEWLRWAQWQARRIHPLG